MAKVAGEPVTTLEVQREARQMLRQQFPRGGAQTEMLLPYFAERAAQNPDQPQGPGRRSRADGLAGHG